MKLERKITMQQLRCFPYSALNIKDIPDDVEVTMTWNVKEKKKIVRDLHVGGSINIVNYAHGILSDPGVVNIGEYIRVPSNSKITIEYEE